MNINVASDIKRLTKHLDDIQRRQIPFAAARALTITAKHAQAAITAQLPSIFDRPTPFTMRAIASTPAKKTDLVAAVFVRPLQARYLELEETGGFRTSVTGKSLPEPVAIPTNAYGNIPRNKIAQLVGKPNYFIGTVKGIKGLWLRPTAGKRRYGASGSKGSLNSAQGFRTHLTLIARFVSGWKIKPKFRFVQRVETDVRKTIHGAIKLEMGKALASRKL